MRRRRAYARARLSAQLREKGTQAILLSRMNEQSFEDAVGRICDRNSDYDADAYFFLKDGLEWTQAKLGRDCGTDHHVTGRELCLGLRDYAQAQFGPLALLVFTQWGIYETADFGAMVYRLIGEGVFGKKPEDRETDFKDIFDFTEAFDPPVAPPRPDVAEKLAEAAPKKPRKPRAKSTGKPAAEK